jgi:ubiquitin carboxyl-terminal hydrolase 22/27/51
MTLDMAPYTTHSISKSPGTRDCTYDLFAVVTHLGGSINKGHYVNYAKFQGEWFCFNDHVVEWVTPDTVLRQKAYPPPRKVGGTDLDISAFILNIAWSMSMMSG